MIGQPTSHMLQSMHAQQQQQQQQQQQRPTPPQLVMSMPSSTSLSFPYTSVLSPSADHPRSSPSSPQLVQMIMPSQQQHQQQHSIEFAQRFLPLAGHPSPNRISTITSLKQQQQTISAPPPPPPLPAPLPLHPPFPKLYLAQHPMMTFRPPTCSSTPTLVPGPIMMAPPAHWYSSQQHHQQQHFHDVCQAAAAASTPMSMPQQFYPQQQTHRPSMPQSTTTIPSSKPAPQPFPLHSSQLHPSNPTPSSPSKAPIITTVPSTTPMKAAAFAASRAGVDDDDILVAAKILVAVSKTASLSPHRDALSSMSLSSGGITKKRSKRSRTASIADLPPIITKEEQSLIGHGGLLTPLQTPSGNSKKRVGDEEEDEGMRKRRRMEFFCGGGGGGGGGGEVHIPKKKKKKNKVKLPVSPVQMDSIKPPLLPSLVVTPPLPPFPRPLPPTPPQLPLPPSFHHLPPHHQPSTHPPRLPSRRNRRRPLSGTHQIHHSARDPTSAVKLPICPPEVNLTEWFSDTSQASIVSWPKGEETLLCKTLRLLPEMYLRIKEVVLGATFTRGVFKKKDVRRWFMIDVNKGGGGVGETEGVVEGEAGEDEGGEEKDVVVVGSDS
ncbi:hypothetical protein BC829DRAFT_493862 [Chytridium lagenaria]|nr:hypothetical protein BC829DRAFT_493862 [Chytridium lagenaria]